jgi:hypothetical protein
VIKISLTILFILLANLTFSQNKEETASYFEHVHIATENCISADSLQSRLDTLILKFIPSRSSVGTYFNRDIDFNFKHRRINGSLNGAAFQIDLLTRNDTIFLSSITTNYESLSYSHQEDAVINDFLDKWNKFYKSSKSLNELFNDLKQQEVYAFYCGDGMPKTEKGVYIEELAAQEDIAVFKQMLNSFNCETQAYGVAGFDILYKSESGAAISSQIRRVIKHIKKRNTELVVCSGCFSGLVEKIY